MVTPSGIVDWINERLDDDDYGTDTKTKISGLGSGTSDGGKRIDKFLEGNWADTQGKKDDRTISEIAQEIMESKIEGIEDVGELTDLSNDIQKSDLSQSTITTLTKTIKDKLTELEPKIPTPPTIPIEEEPPPELTGRERRTQLKRLIGQERPESTARARIKEANTETEIQEAITEATDTLTSGELGEIIDNTTIERIIASIEDTADIKRQQLKENAEL